MRIFEDIFTLGFHELGLFLADLGFHGAVSSAITGKGSSVVDNLLEAVELPGGAVFTFDQLDWRSEGLRIGLRYK